MSEICPFVTDSDLDLSLGDVLGTSPYVAVLRQTLECCETPFTIGLVGGWGTGKSSVIKTLRLQLQADDHAKTAVFVYDAWKYSRDSFYRMFLYELSTQFNLSSEDKFKAFYQDSHEDVETTAHVNPAVVPKVLMAAPLLVAIVVSLLTLPTSVKIGFGGLSLCVAVMAFLLGDLYTQYKVTVTRPHLFAPEQFEAAFAEAVDDILSKQGPREWFKPFAREKKYSKILIVIDNIDRCHREMAVELLLTVKNFLEIPGVVFILPLDDRAVMHHLALPPQEAAEFLRKLLNVTLTMKTFTQDDLFEFAQTQNEVHELDLPPLAISMVCQEFASNPRRVIQFLNNLHQELELGRIQESAGLLSPGAITGDIPMLAKILIIRDQWPDFYARLQDDPGLLGRVRTHMSTGAYVWDGDARIYSAGLDWPDLTEEQWRFLTRTTTTTAPSVEAFMVNRDALRGFPDTLPSLIASQDWRRIAMQLRGDEYTMSGLLDVIMVKADRDVVRRGLMASTGFNACSLVAQILADPEFGHIAVRDFDQTRIGNLARITNHPTFDTIIDDFNPAHLLTLATFLQERGGDLGLIAAVANHLNRALGAGHPSRPSDGAPSAVGLLEEYVSRVGATADGASVRPAIAGILSEQPRLADGVVKALEDIDSSTRPLLDSAVAVSLVEFVRNGDTDTNDLAVVARAMALLLDESIDDQRGLDEELGRNPSETIAYVKAVAWRLESFDWDVAAFWYPFMLPLVSRVSDDSDGTQALVDSLAHGYSAIQGVAATPGSTDHDAEAALFAQLLTEVYAWCDDDGRLADWIGTLLRTTENVSVLEPLVQGVLEAITASGPFNHAFYASMVARYLSDSPLASTLETLAVAAVQSSDQDLGLSVSEFDDVLANWLAAKPSDARVDAVLAACAFQRFSASVVAAVDSETQLASEWFPVLWPASESVQDAITRRVLAGSKEQEAESGIRQLVAAVGPEDALSAALRYLRANIVTPVEYVRVLRAVARLRRLLGIGDAAVTDAAATALGFGDRALQFYAIDILNDTEIPLSSRAQLRVLLDSLDRAGLGTTQRRRLAELERVAKRRR